MLKRVIISKNIQYHLLRRDLYHKIKQKNVKSYHWITTVHNYTHIILFLGIELLKELMFLGILMVKIMMFNHL